MQNIHIAGTGLWHPLEKISNDELVNSYNAYVKNFNSINKNEIDAGNLQLMEYSSVEFI